MRLITTKLKKVMFKDHTRAVSNNCFMFNNKKKRLRERKNIVDITDLPYQNSITKYLTAEVVKCNYIF